MARCGFTVPLIVFLRSVVSASNQPQSDLCWEGARGYNYLGLHFQYTFATILTITVILYRR
jgi:hypothetical protein